MSDLGHNFSTTSCYDKDLQHDKTISSKNPGLMCQISDNIGETSSNYVYSKKPTTKISHCEVIDGSLDTKIIPHKTAQLGY